MLWIVSIFQWEFFMVGINLITGLQPLLGTPEGIHRGCMIIKKQVFATNRDPWVTYLQVSVAKEGKVFDKKNHCSHSCLPMREQKWVVLFFFSKFDKTVYSNPQFVKIHGTALLVPRRSWFFSYDVRKSPSSRTPGKARLSEFTHNFECFGIFIANFCQNSEPFGRMGQG